MYVYDSLNTQKPSKLQWPRCLCDILHLHYFLLFQPDNLLCPTVFHCTSRFNTDVTLKLPCRDVRFKQFIEFFKRSILRLGKEKEHPNDHDETTNEPDPT